MLYLNRSARRAENVWRDGDLAAALVSLAFQARGEPTYRFGDELRFGHRGSLSVDTKRGVWFDHEAGAGGGALDFAVHIGLARDRAEARKGLRLAPTPSDKDDRSRVDAAACTQVPARPATAMAEREHAPTAARARALWMDARPLSVADLAGRYLAARAIPWPWPDALRFHGAVWCAEAGRKMPALVAAVTDTEGRVVAVQRTWLAEPGRKARLAAPKKTLGPIRGAAVWLGPAAAAVLIAEGVETALSAGRALNLPTVATFGAGNFKTLMLPMHVTRVVIAPDRDARDVGARAARALAERLAREGRAVALAWPPQGAKDWNDWAMALAGEVSNG